jgi:hypothetical protein
MRYLIKLLMSFITRSVMGAIAVSKKEEEQIEKLRKELGIATKSGLIRTALRALEKSPARKKGCVVTFAIRSAAALRRIARRIKNYLRPALPAPTAVSKCRSSAGICMLSISTRG